MESYYQHDLLQLGISTWGNVMNSALHQTFNFESVFSQSVTYLFLLQLKVFSSFNPIVREVIPTGD
jgi:hypothetical protein